MHEGLDETKWNNIERRLNITELAILYKSLKMK